MFQFIKRLFSRRIIILNVQRYGPRLPWAEVQSIFRGRDQDTLYRAIGQVLEYQRQICQCAVQDKSNIPSAQTAFEAGAAASAADVMSMLSELAAGQCTDAGLKAWFGGDSKPKESP